MPSQALESRQAQTPFAAADTDRSPDKFIPSIWQDHFLSYASMETADIIGEQHVQDLKEEVKKMLMAPVKKPSQKLDLINHVQRLGVSYHFEDEIDEILQRIHKNSYECDDLENDMDDLYTVALRFRLLRQQGYSVSCDMFSKFKNDDGKFKASVMNDIPGLLSLYEATHLRIHGEDILDEALTFTRTQLEYHLAAAQHLSTPSLLSKQVTRALRQPVWKGVPRLEARHYLSIYQELESRDETLLTYAKLDFSLVQRVHQTELCEVTRWWKELDFANKLPFMRDRVVESYFWAMVAYFEPKYYFRKYLGKIIYLMTAIDDIYDVRGTLEELELFTEAMERWDVSAMAPLPEYMQVCYQAILDVYNELGEALANEGNLYGIHYARETLKIMVRGYIQEAKWSHQKYIPTTDEHMRAALATSAFSVNLTAIIGMPDIATKDSLDWLINDPKIVKASSIVGRLLNDMSSYQHDHKRQGDVASAVECYLKQHGTTEEETMVELKKQAAYSWKDLNEGLIHPTPVAKPLLMRILNVTRFCEVNYKSGDHFTRAGVTLKDLLTSLYIDPVPV